ncbi:transient receptor potential channel pyrexia [Ischnura elegans]|uniref:transient receptor potential channel pyrexia n=1 Tax=Ischnura elegans TaxID=197161 RepID=UPI001ED8AD7E|nr:transient receptor potential channel pyrexia [Ischnura elegans]
MEKKRVRMDRATSMTVVERKPSKETSFRYKSVTPSLLKRLKSRKQRELMPADDRKSVEGISNDAVSSGDEVYLGDLVEKAVEIHHSMDDVLSVRICKDRVRHSLMDRMRRLVGSSGVKLLESIEASNEEPDAIDPYTMSSKKVIFLWATFVGRADIVNRMLKEGVGVDTRDEETGLGPVHLCALSGDPTVARALISRNADVNSVSLGRLQLLLTPLHCAALGNSPDVLKLLLSSGAELSVENEDETALGYAVRANATECLDALVAAGASVNAFGARGYAPLHVAAELSHMDCIPILLTAGADLHEKTQDHNGFTPLHILASDGEAEGVKVLLKAGASPAAVDARGQSPLHLSARAQAADAVGELLRAGADPNLADSEGRTPLHVAVSGRRRPAFSVPAVETVTALLNANADPSVSDAYGRAPLHLAAINELPGCVDALIRAGADLTARSSPPHEKASCGWWNLLCWNADGDDGIDGPTTLGLVARRTPACLSTVVEMLDSAISLSDHDDPESPPRREVEVRLDFRALIRHGGGRESRFMKTMVDEGQAESLLEHPLCRAFLHLKWGRVRKFYLARILLCTIFVLVFSFYAIITNGCVLGGPESGSGAGTNESEVGNAGGCSGDDCTNGEGKENVSAADNCKSIPVVLTEISFYCLCVLIVIEVLRKGLGILGSSATSVRHYVFQGQNLLEWAMLIGAVILCALRGISGTHESFVRPIVSISLLCAWIDLLTVIGHLPTFAAYVHMYSTVLKEFYRLLFAYACLLIGFMMAFMILYPGNDKFPTSPVSFVKVLMFATGELSDELLKDDHIIPLLVFVMFILLVTVALMNLLVGIAVHDIQGLQRTAGLTGLIQQTELVAYVESALFAGAGKVCCGLRFRLLRLLRRSALVSPSAYRVVLSVRPCDPRDRRLPPSVTADALEVARSRNKLRRMASEGPNGSADAFSTQSTLSRFCHHCNTRSSLEGSGKRDWEGKLMKTELSRLSKEVGDIKKSLDKISVALETLVNTSINSHKPHRKISEESL